MAYSDFQIFNITDVHQLLIIVHLIGLALGAGAALFSDFLFTTILKDGKLSKTEFDHLKLASKVVWLGLLILIISGLLIFLDNSDRLLDSPKFLAKMTIIAVLTINGLVFHFYQIPKLKKLVNKELFKNKQFRDVDSKPFFIGGAVSGVSWIAALVLGSLDYIDMTYWQIMTIYGVVVLISAIAALRLRSRYINE